MLALLKWATDGKFMRGLCATERPQRTKDHVGKALEIFLSKEAPMN